MARKIETNVVKPETKFEYLGKEYLHIDSEQELLLDSKIDLVNQFMKNNSGKGKESQEQDALYGESQKLWQDFIATLESTKYNFYLNKDQWKFLTDLIYSKLEYDVNTVFFAIELTDMLATMKDTKYTNDKDLVAFEVNATEITYIYHLISKHKVKGLTNDAYLFSQVLYRIGSISKIFNYYETCSKNLAKDVQDWVLTFEDGISFDKITDTTVEGEVIEPKA